MITNKNFVTLVINVKGEVFYVTDMCSKVLQKTTHATFDKQHLSVFVTFSFFDKGTGFGSWTILKINPDMSKGSVASK
jgi:hypothetical protein